MDFDFRWYAAIFGIICIFSAAESAYDKYNKTQIELAKISRCECK